MLRLLFALVVLAGAPLFAPTAAAAVAPDAAAAAAAPGVACYQQGNQIHCNELPSDWTCADLQSVIDSTNSTGTSDPITMLGCEDATRIAFNGMRAVSPMRIGERGPIRDGDDAVPGGSHVGVFVSYVRDEAIHLVEAGEGSDLGALLTLATAGAGCGPDLPFSVVTLATDGPGSVTVNGRRVEVEQVDVRVERGERAELYGRILIKGEPIEFE